MIPATSTADDVKALVTDRDGPISLLSVERLAGVCAASSAEGYQEQVLKYITGWTKTVSSIVDAELEVFDRLEEVLYHYEVKVDELRNKSKGKETPKLARNETKLRNAGERRNVQLKRVCSLLKEIAENSWRDLYPLVNQTIIWETNRLDGEIDTYGELLPQTLEGMREGIKAKDHAAPVPHESIASELSNQKRCNLKLEYRINCLEGILRNEWSTREDITLKLKDSLKFDAS